MTGNEMDQNELSETMNSVRDPNEPDPGGAELRPDGMKLRPLDCAEILSADIERFSTLSSEMTEILSRLSREIKDSTEQLSRVRSEIEEKTGELKAIVDASAAALERLDQEYREKKESLDRRIEAQRELWEAQDLKREQEELEYLENLRIRREREEEEYAQFWASEKLKAQQKLEEDLRTIREESLSKQQEIERDLQGRELALKQKELEWIQLIQELEQFMVRLTRKTQVQAAARSEQALKETPKHGSFRESGLPEAGLQKDPAENGSASGFIVVNHSGPEITSEERMEILPDADPPLEEDPADGPDAAISSLKEMLLTQGRRIENLNSEPARRDPAPLRFLPKKPLI